MKINSISTLNQQTFKAKPSAEFVKYVYARMPKTSSPQNFDLTIRILDIFSSIKKTFTSKTINIVPTKSQDIIVKLNDSHLTTISREEPLLSNLLKIDARMKGRMEWLRRHNPEHYRHHVELDSRFNSSDVSLRLGEKSS